MENDRTHCLHQMGCTQCIQKIGDAGARDSEAGLILNKFAVHKPLFRPLDLVTFRGAGFVSDGISLVGQIKGADVGNSWTHVGILVNSDILPISVLKTDDPKRWFVWESSVSYNEVPDVYENKSVKGVQIRDFESVCSEYAKHADTEVSVFRLDRNPWVDAKNDAGKQDQLKRQLKELHDEYKGRPYDFTGMSAALCCCLRKLRDNSGSLVKSLHDYAVFSSELVAMVYRRLRIISEDVQVDNVSPSDFFTGKEGISDSIFDKQNPRLTVIQTGRRTVVQ